ELTEAGVVHRRRLGPPAAATVYELTAWGAQLEPILLQLGRWAAHTPVDLREQTFSVSSFALSLRTTFDSDTAGEVELHLWFVIGEEILDARIQRGDFQIQRLPQSSDPPPPSRDRPPRIDSDPKTLAAIIHAGLPPAEAADQGALRVEGSPDVLPAFPRCFKRLEPPVEGHPCTARTHHRAAPSSPTSPCPWTASSPVPARTSSMAWDAAGRRSSSGSSPPTTRPGTAPSSNQPIRAPEQWCWAGAPSTSSTGPTGGTRRSATPTTIPPRPCPRSSWSPIRSRPALATAASPT